MVSHWRCLTKPQRDDIIRAASAKAEEKGESGPRFRDLDASETTEFVCSMCSKASTCMGCEQTATEEVVADASVENAIPEIPDELLFRCISCKRVAHYAHLFVDVGDDGDMDRAEKAQFFQEDNQWQCNDCASYRFPVDKVIAWRPSPPTAIDKYMNAVEKFNYKDNLPREYLVKWATRSYRRVQWVPHMWMVSTQYAKLKNFYEHGPKIQLLEGPIGELSKYKPQSKAKGSLFATEDEVSRATSVDVEAGLDEARAGAFPTARPDAEQRIPPLWRTIERVLDVKLQKSSRRGKGKRLADGDDGNDGDMSMDMPPEIQRIFDEGEEPSEDMAETVEDFERHARRELEDQDINQVLWAFIKWDDLPYDEGMSLTSHVLLHSNQLCSDLGFAASQRDSRI